MHQNSAMCGNGLKEQSTLGIKFLAFVIFPVFMNDTIINT